MATPRLGLVVEDKPTELSCEYVYWGGVEGEGEREREGLHKSFIWSVGVDLVIPTESIDKLSIRSSTQSLKHSHITLRWYVPAGIGNMAISMYMYMIYSRLSLIWMGP